MDLRKRLAQFDRLANKPRPGSRNGEQAGGGDRHAQQAADDASVLAELGLRAHATPAGRLFERRWPPEADLLPPTGLSDLTAIFSAPAPADLLPGELLFLDTETTGLGGGTGSLAFLVGVGWWTTAGFEVRQFFLPGPGQELPLLRALSALADERRVVVTFNGNGFDLPLLRTRARLAGCEDPCGELISWDLLPASRKLWARRLPDCRQQTLEQSICGTVRGPGDIEGWQIPQTYFRYLRHGETDALTSVLTHNQRDMRGMALILREVSARVNTLRLGPQAGLPEAVSPWEDAWSNGRLCEASGEASLAAAWLRMSLDLLGPFTARPLQSEPPETFFVDAVRILKRTGDWPRQEQLIASALRFLGDRAWLHREAAILYEHRLHLLEKAVTHAHLAAEPERLARLQRKLGHG